MNWKIYVLILMLLPMVVSAQECYVGLENITLIPSDINITIEQNRSASFVAKSVIYGECDATLMTYSNCSWCYFTFNGFNQQHGSYIDVDILISVPPLPTSQTNHTYPFDIKLKGQNTDARYINLSVIVPYNVTNVTEEWEEPEVEPEWNMTYNWSDILSKLNRTEQLYLALILNDIFKDIDWDFIRRETVEQIVTVPVIHQIPINLEAYREWMENCNPQIYGQLEDKYRECNQTRNVFMSSSQEWEGKYTHCLETSDSVCRNRTDPVITNLTQERDEAFMYLYYGLILMVLFMAFLYWKFKFREPSIVHRDDRTMPEFRGTPSPKPSSPRSSTQSDLIELKNHILEEPKPDEVKE